MTAALSAGGVVSLIAMLVGQPVAAHQDPTETANLPTWISSSPAWDTSTSGLQW